MDVLREKHPAPAPGPPLPALLQGPILPTHPVVFEVIDSKFIRSIALQLSGAAGNSGLDSGAWKRMCCSFGSASSQLCAAVACLTRRLATCELNPEHLQPLLSGRLIPLDKSPGVHPIGIGEVLRRLVAKAILQVTKQDIKAAAGSLQVCAGQEAGIEAAVHAIQDTFAADRCEGVLLVDATNAFNSVNRAAMMHNIRILCPAMATITTNFYQAPVPLHVAGEVIQSSEGTTQGDPLAMPLYALAIIPLIDSLAQCSPPSTPSSGPDLRQLWYADDAGAAGLVQRLRLWWDSLVDLGPLFGYYPNPTKTWLVVKEEHAAEARHEFAGTGVQITTEGRPYLGTPIGSPASCEAFSREQVQRWCEEVHRLADLATSEPQAAYAALTFGLQHRWTYSMRTPASLQGVLAPLDDALRGVFLPALLGHNVDSNDFLQLLSLPVRCGGLGIIIPSRKAPTCFALSWEVTTSLRTSILQQFSLYDPDLAAAHLAKRDARKLQDEQVKAFLRDTAPAVLPCRLVEANCLKGAGAWLSCLLLPAHGYDLDWRSFRDGLAIRYNLLPVDCPSHCACGAAFGLDHAMICCLGGLLITRHNHVRDLVASLLRHVNSDVATEPPPLLPLLGQDATRLSSESPAANTSPDARLDVKARGFWTVQSDAFFDVRVFYPNALTYRSRPLAATFNWHEQQKRREYGDRVRNVERAVFTPLVMTSSGGMAPEAAKFLQFLAKKLAEKLGEPYSLLLRKIRTDLAFSLLRDSVLMIRSSRRAFRHPLYNAVDLVVADTRMSS